MKITSFDAICKGIMSSFFIQPLIPTKRKPLQDDFSVFLIRTNALRNDWEKIGIDITVATKKVIINEQNIDEAKKTKLLRRLSRYESKTT